MEKGRAAKNLRLSSRADLQRKQRRRLAGKGPKARAKTNPAQRCFADIIRKLAIILLKRGT
jgi:hypothetical protein